ncbi:MAG: AMP-binding protein [Verrucomicrobiota bacterium]
MTLSYTHGVSNLPLIGRTIGDLLDDVVATHGANEAVVSVFENKRLTYSAFLDEVNCCARALIAIGIQKGDRVGVWSTNCVTWIVIQFATAKIGAIQVNINPAYRRQELEFALQQSECNALISGEGFKDADYAQMLQELIPDLSNADPHADFSPKKFPHLRRVIYLGEQRKAGMLGWSELMPLHQRISPAMLSERQAALDFDEVINIQYTSGTTGFPKGAMLSHHNILNNGYWAGVLLNFTHKDRLCIPVPFYHCFGMVLGNLTCVTHGATIVLPAPHFSPLATLQAVAKERCTALHGVPTMFIAELEHPQFREFDLSSLRTGVMAGAPCPIEVMKRVISEMHCDQITIGCGMTEASPLCNMTKPDDPLELRVSTIGRVVPHQEQKVVDPESGRILPCGKPGELCYRGYQIMRGYYNNPEGTKNAIDPYGWMHSGDLAVMDERGYVKITGRLKDLIIRGGENIYPREVEEFLFTHPKIAEAAVFGVPDSHYGEQVTAWIKLKDGATLTEKETREFCKGKITDHKVPYRIKFVTEFPTTVTGKIQKFRMREISVEELKLVE